MLKLIVVLVALGVFIWYATNSFEDTFGEDKKRAEEVQQQ